MTPDLATLATGHAHSRFGADVGAHGAAMRAALAGKRMLVIGGAGSIGAATVRAVLPFAPAAVHVIDQDENGLAELVRDLRSAGLTPRGLDLRLQPLDYGGGAARRFLAGAGPYDVALHFAALKHVRSEKDSASILQMIDTNVLKQATLISWLAEDGAPARYFAVSTDKAANPVNFMGASKRLMEQLIFTDTVTPLGVSTRTSARFANVAFSAGSLLASWGERLRKRQPVAVPRDTRRYFVSLAEAAEICLLAAAALPDRHVAVPAMRPESDLRELAPIAEGFVVAAGFRAAWYEDEAVARAAVEDDAAHGAWPVLSTPRDTDGEKPEEEFVGAGETARDVGMAALRGIPQRGFDASTLRGVLDELALWVAQPRLRADKEAIAATIARVVPEFHPARRGKSLDDRM
ncbi:MAG: polysaccharide biosynthesis protein [Gemmatimonadales bacterium]